MCQIKRAYVLVASCLLLAAGGSVRQANSQAASPTLDYQFFKDKVQAIFLHKREGHTRCVACHRQNFQWVQRVVVPGYEDSLLLKHPLAEAAGGDPRHGGGQQFASKNDPDWQTLKAWVMGAK